MSDLYVHDNPVRGGWDHRQDNLVTLGRHLVLNAAAIRSAGGLSFTGSDMAGLPLPDTLGVAIEVPLPPLAHGPLAGLLPEPGEDWPAYMTRVFGIYDHRGFMVWLQSPMWQKTDPSPEGAALRIAYVLDYGVPHDHAEIAMGQVYSDYDTSGFLWEKLDLFASDHMSEGQTWGLRNRPAWIGAVELDRLRSGIKADFLLPPGEATFSKGLPAGEIATLAQRLGPIPAVYHDFLLLSGRRTSEGETGPYADRLDAIGRLARDRIVAGADEADDPVPPDAIFIGLQDGRNPEFILGGERHDSPVFLFNADTGRVTQTSLSIFGWIATFMATADPADAVPAVSSPGGAFRRLIRRLFS